jgi:hypothetical protein
MSVMIRFAASDGSMAKDIFAANSLARDRTSIRVTSAPIDEATRMNRHERRSLHISPQVHHFFSALSQFSTTVIGGGSCATGSFTTNRFPSGSARYCSS